MNKINNRNLKKPLITGLIFLVFFALIFSLRSRYRKDDNPGRSSVELTTNLFHDSIQIFPKRWKYYPGDIKNGEKKDLDDNEWKNYSTELLLDSAEGKTFKGICWFRSHFRVSPKLVGKVMSIQVTQLGASEFYLDGKKLDAFGKPSADKASEQPLRPLIPLLFAIPDTNWHVMAIRYSNQNYEENFKRYNEPFSGMELLFEHRGKDTIYQNIVIRDLLVWLVSLSVFFFTLAFIHFLLYIFYRENKANLHYSIFVFLFAVLMYLPYHLANDSSSEDYVRINYYFLPFLSLFLFAILNCIYSLFKPSHWKKMLLIELSVILLALVIYFVNPDLRIPGAFIIALMLFTCIEAIRSVNYARIRKQKGVGIIGTGVVIFFLFIFTLIIEVMVTDHVGFVTTESGSIYLMILVLFCIISIPVSMSIYLAWNSAFINRSLEIKLNEVEELSAKSIEQEKEKQHILSSQNAMLEQQVNERTLEIREQKKVIEEKNKDIIDSINYAKRIQAAMLPDESQFKDIFGDSFILYQPRDIVSGDFYYATELDGKKLVLAADCTGHGVPGALMSMVGSNIINKLVHENNVLDPKLLLEKLHEQLRQALKQDQKGSVNRDGMDVAVVLIDGNSVIYAGANRPLVYFDRNRQLQEIKPVKTPVGGSHIESISISSHTLERENISEIFLFSDGFADQFGGPDGKKLMVSKFKAWLNEIAELDAGEQLLFLSNNFQEWKSNTEQVDDVMVIGIKLK